MNFEYSNMAVRPGIYAFTSDSVEFHRWYEYGGNPRPEPLTREELVEKIGADRVNKEEHSAFTKDEWERFKSDRLGPLKGPVETLQMLVREYATDALWWEPCRDTADWCKTPERPCPVKVHNALYGLVFRAEADSQHNGTKLPEWISDAELALNVVKAAFPSINDGSTLMNEYKMMKDRLERRRPRRRPQ